MGQYANPDKSGTSYANCGRDAGTGEGTGTGEGKDSQRSKVIGLRTLLNR